MGEFADWVQPIAEKLAASRAEVAEVARAVPETKWGDASPDNGWTYKDLLAHLAVGDWALQYALRTVVGEEEIDMTVMARFNEINEGYRKERLVLTVDELISEVGAMGKETQRLLRVLKPKEQQVARWKLNELLDGFMKHDPAHLAELRTALEAQR